MAFRWRKSPNKIVRTKIADDGKVALLMATTWARLIHKFVPMQSGVLGRPLIERNNPNEAAIIYNTPYARRQYFGTANPNSPGGVTKHNFSRTKPLATHRWHEKGLRAGLKTRLVKEVANQVRRGLR